MLKQGKGSLSVTECLNIEGKRNFLLYTWEHSILESLQEVGEISIKKKTNVKIVEIHRSLCHQMPPYPRVHPPFRSSTRTLTKYMMLIITYLKHLAKDIWSVLVTFAEHSLDSGGGQDIFIPCVCLDLWNNYFLT